MHVQTAPTPLPETTTPLRLAPMLDLTAADALHRLLLASIEPGGALAIDGAEVERASTPCLQLLVAAAASARAHGGTFKIVTPSVVLGKAIQDLDLGRALGMET